MTHAHGPMILLVSAWVRHSHSSSVFGLALNSILSLDWRALMIRCFATLHALAILCCAQTALESRLIALSSAPLALSIELCVLSVPLSVSDAAGVCCVIFCVARLVVACMAPRSAELVCCCCCCAIEPL